MRELHIRQHSEKGAEAATCHLPTEFAGPRNCFTETSWKLESMNCPSLLTSVVGCSGFTTHISPNICCGFYSSHATLGIG